MIEGNYYLKDSSLKIKASLDVDGDLYKVNTIEENTYNGLVDKLDIPNRLGNVERKIILEDGSIFTTYDNDAVDLVLKKNIKHKGILHKLESNMYVVVLALVSSILLGFVFFKWGIPWSSQKIAHALPEKTKQLISTNTLEFLDEYIFKESKISQVEIDRIKKHFQSKVLPITDIKDKSGYKLHFRLLKSADVSLPNAMALPSGDIILTDKFVELCQNQEEMDSILLHEIGHVVHRHSLKTIIESTFISVAVLMVVGDANVMADMGIGVGSLLVSSNYSRGHESEADKYSFEYMLRWKKDPIAFSNIMNRMESYMENVSESNEKSESEESVFDYVSSHPQTQKRVKIAEEYSECFKKGFVIFPCK